MYVIRGAVALPCRSYRVGEWHEATSKFGLGNPESSDPGSPFRARILGLGLALGFAPLDRRPPLAPRHLLAMRVYAPCAQAITTAMAEITIAASKATSRTVIAKPRR